MENHNVYFVEYVNNSEIQPGSSQVPKIRLISQSQSSHVVAPPPAPHQATVQQATSVQQSTSIPPPVHIPSASVLQISKTRRSGRVQKAAIIKAPAGQSAHVRPSTRVRQAENVRQVASVKQSANVSRPAAHIRQPTRVRQPESDRQAAGMGQPINVSLPAPQARQSTRARQSGNETQAASVRLVADAGQSMNIRQTAVVQSFESILQPVCTRQTAILRPFVNNPQSTSAQQVTIVPSFTNVQQRRSSTHFANIQQPANVQQSADNQPPVSSQQSTSKQQSASNQQPVNDQQPASIEQSTSVQQSTSTGQTASVQQSMKNRVIFGNVVQLSQAELKKIVANAQLKQKNTGSLAVRLQNDKLVKFIYRDNVLQSLNQRPGQPMNMPGMQNKMPGMGMMPAQTGGPMSHMGPIQTMQNNPMLTQMNQMGQGNIPQQMNQMVPGQMSQLATGQMQQNMQSQMQNQLPGQMANQIGGPIGGIQTSMPQQMSQIGPGQLGPGQMQQQLNHIQRKPGEMMNTGFPGPRNVTPNQFLRQSPSPSAPSPAGLGAPSSNQMVASPALVPSPSPQHGIMTGPSRSVNSVGMAPSPSSSLNTPGGVGATPSPQQEDQAYRDKIRQLSKYIEPLRRMIAKTSSEGNVDKLSKMKKLLEILSNPSKRMPLDTLLKCEIVLEKLDFKRGDGSVGPPVTTLKEHQIFSPLLEAVSAHLQSPVINHTLQRTFGPYLGALFAPEIKNLPPPLKKQKVEEPPSEIPDVLQGEIARLDQRFKVSLDPAQQNGSKCIQLICWLDDRHLPCVPPVSVTVPADYPLTPPRCVMAPHEYEATTFLCDVQKALNARIEKLPRRFSLSQLLDTWEMSVRQASARTQVTVTASTVLMGL